MPTASVGAERLEVLRRDGHGLGGQRAGRVTHDRDGDVEVGRAGRGQVDAVVCAEVAIETIVSVSASTSAWIAVSSGEPAA